MYVLTNRDGNCEFNLFLADEVASELLEDLRAADQPTELYPLPVYLRYGTGHIITSSQKRTLTNEFPEYELRQT
jgi:hypothetical protein